MAKFVSTVDVDLGECELCEVELVFLSLFESVPEEAKSGTPLSTTESTTAGSLLTSTDVVEATVGAVSAWIGPPAEKLGLIQHSTLALC